jgi:hypothetical protein
MELVRDLHYCETRSVIFAIVRHKERPAQGLDGFPYVPGLARLKPLTTMRTFSQLALDDYALGFLKYSSGSMAGRFCHGVCLRFYYHCTIT